MRMDYDERIKKIDGNNNNDFKKAIALLNALRKELSTFNYKNDYYKLSHFLFRLNEIRPSLATKKQSLIDAEVLKIHNVVRDLIVSRPNYINKKDSNFTELRTIIDNLEGMNLSYIYNCVDKYDGNAYNLLRYLMFEEKNLFLVEYTLDHYPYLVNMRDSNYNNSIIVEVVDNYLKSIVKYIDSDLKYSDDLFFFDQILEILMDSPKMNFSLRDIKKNLKMINDFLENYDYSQIDITKKKKLTFWINELRSKLENRPIDKNLSYLAYKTDINTDFDEAVLSETKFFESKNLYAEYAKRKMITDEFVITVDGENAEEIDDGLSIKKLENGNYLLGVHISDPAGYVDKNSILYDEAYHRTTSIYSLLERTSSMFPEVYAKDYMSLIENQNRFCTSYYLEITPKGDILLDNCYFKKSIVKVDRSLTYDSFKSLAQTGSDDQRLDKTIELLQEVSDILSKHIVMDERYQIVNRGSISDGDFNANGNSNSEKIVEYAMIAVNATVANYAAKKGIPFIYRGHELSKEYLEQVEYYSNTFKNNDDYDSFIKFLKDTYPTAFYTTDKNISHMGIGVPHYCHLTSPLRRFADCLANEALDLFYFHDDVSDDVAYEFEERLKEGCQYINNKKKMIDYFSKNYAKLKKKD